MTTPTRRIRPGGRRRRSFDLRATAVFFGLLALLLSSAGFVVRSAAGALRHSPVWMVVLCLVVTATVLVLRRHRTRRGFSAKRTALRAAAALQEATHTTLDLMETRTAPAVAAPAVDDAPPAGTPLAFEQHIAGNGTELTIPLPDTGAAARPLTDTACLDDTATVAVAEPEVVYVDDTAGAGTVDYDALDADEFERAIAGLCERDGCFPVEVVGGAGDLGADVLAVAPDGRRVVVQCKRYCDSNRCGSQDLQRFGGTCYTVHEADVAVVVTTSDFTAPAVEYAEQCGIVCVDGAALRAWSDGTGPAPWNA
ncbi:restriction endonuclease [Streptomyces sp. NPDC089424]|uniref:restriction endonuclease n=1 Tax=Streptomyces sp. NPDC089424 TaxID=3365917 RepID=UPI0037FAEF70